MKNFIISGLTSGIGFELAIKALEDGHHVLGILRNQNTFKQSKEYKALIDSGSIQFFELDLKKSFEPENKKQFLKHLKHLDSIDYVLHFAGYLEGGAWEDLSSVSLMNQLQVNVLNIHTITRLTFPYLNDDAKVIAAGSVASHFNYPLMGPYCCSKHALRSMFESWFYEGAYRKIQFCHLSLGPIQTPFWNKSREANKIYSKDYGQPLNAISDLSLKIEARGMTTEYVVNKIWNKIHKKHLPQDWVIVKNYFFDFWLLKVCPNFIKHAVTRRLLKLPNQLTN